MTILSFKETVILNEARRSNLKYIEKKAGDSLDRVITTLEGTESATMSKLAGRFKRLEQAIKRMSTARDELKNKLKDDVAEYFNADEILLTRVVETVSFTLTLSKTPTIKEKTVYDHEKIAEELTKLVEKGLEEKVKEIYETYKKVTPAKLGTPTIDADAKITEGISTYFSKFVDYMKKLTKSVTSWAVTYDKQLEALRKQFV